jgi:hypothetical protein
VLGDVLGLICALVLGVLVSESATLAVSENPPPSEVSMAVLLAHPAQHKDKTVSFYAFGVFQFEESSLYLSQLHAELMDVANQLPLLDEIDHSEFNGRLVRIEAVFRVDDSRPRGYLDSTKQIVAARKVRTFE